MAANSSIALTQLDFDSNKSALKTYLKEQDLFKDYDFEDSNLSVLLDILSYNTYLNAFYLNMIGNEMFLDSASLRDSVVSHAKELNYVPRSFTSALAKVDITVISTDETLKSIVIPRGTSLLSRVGDKTYTFTTDDVVTVSSSNGTFVATDVEIYEGIFLSDTYAVDYENPLQFKISNKRVDISSVAVTVIEDNGATQLEYKSASSLFGHDETSKIFFVQPSSRDTYEVVFGDGVIGRKPKNNSIVVIEYRVSSGELPNGAAKFIFTGKIDGQSNITVRTIMPATGGAVAETLESIKYNAPRAFTTQERAVTAEDYENLLKINFPEINAVAAYGGEEADPPQYGKVFVSIDLNDVDGLPDIKKNEYYKFLRSRSSIAMEPIFVSPEYTYVHVDSTVKYNINITNKNPADIKTSVVTSILNFSREKLNNFNRTLRYSRLVKAIDDADDSIISNETDVLLVKYITPTLNVPQDINIDFKTSIDIPPKFDEHSVVNTFGISLFSSKFTFAGQTNCNLEDDGSGKVLVVSTRGDAHEEIAEVGTVDYETGKIKLSGFIISDFAESALRIFASPKTKDVTAIHNVILNVIEPDIDLKIEQIRE